MNTGAFLYVFLFIVFLKDYVSYFWFSFDYTWFYTRLISYSFGCAFLRQNPNHLIWDQVSNLFEHLQIVLGLCHFYRWPDSHYNTILPNLILKAIPVWGCLAFVPMYHLEWLSPFYKWGSWSPVSWSNFLQIIASRRWKWYSNSGLFGPKLIVFPLFHSGFLY